MASLPVESERGVSKRSLSVERGAYRIALLSGVSIVLLILAPVGSAHGAVAFRAPFSGFSASTFPYSQAIGSCATAHNAVPVNWNSTNGTIHFRGSAGIGNCAGTQTAEAFGEVSLLTPAFPTPFPGNGSVVVFVRDGLLASGSVHAGTSTSDDATAYVYVFVEIWESTSRGPLLIASSTVYLLNQYLFTTGTFAVIQLPNTTAISTPVAFAPTHVYEVQVTIVAKVTVDASGGGYTSASLDLSGGNGVTLRAISAV